MWVLSDSKGKSDLALSFLPLSYIFYSTILILSSSVISFFCLQGLAVHHEGGIWSMLLGSHIYIVILFLNPRNGWCGQQLMIRDDSKYHPALHILYFFFVWILLVWCGVCLFFLFSSLFVFVLYISVFVFVLSLLLFLLLPSSISAEEFNTLILYIDFSG